MPKAQTRNAALTEDRHNAILDGTARALDEFLNGTEAPARGKIGFILVVFPLDEIASHGKCVTNGVARDDVVAVLKKQLAHLEGQADRTSAP